MEKSKRGGEDDVIDKQRLVLGVASKTFKREKMITGDVVTKERLVMLVIEKSI